MPISLGVWEWGCPYHCDSGKGKDVGKRLVRAKESRKERNGFTSHISFPWSLALRHQLLAFRPRLYVKYKVPE